MIGPIIIAYLYDIIAYIIYYTIITYYALFLNNTVSGLCRAGA